MIPSAPKWAGRIAVITGASRGLGAEIAKQLGAEGVQCVLLARTVGGLEEVDDAIRKAGGPHATLVPCDLSKNHDALDHLGSQLYQRHDKIDFLVCCAAMLDSLSPVGHIQPSTWEKTMAVNATAHYRLTRSLDPLLRQGKNPQAVFVTCKQANSSEPFWAAYAASKSALQRMAESYRTEVSSFGIRVHIADPGPMATALHARAFPGADKSKLKSAAEAAQEIVRLL